MSGGMTPEEAERVLIAAVRDIDAFVDLTTAPTDEQRIAIRSLDPDAIAPDVVCDEFDVDRGSTWAVIQREVAFDVGTSIEPS